MRGVVVKPPWAVPAEAHLIRRLLVGIPTGRFLWLALERRYIRRCGVSVYLGVLVYLDIELPLAGYVD